MKVLIISGGISSERKISLISAKAVSQALQKNNHQTRIFDLKNGYQKLKKVVSGFDVIFPVIHGEEGEGGELHKYLIKLGKPFVGGNYQGFKTGWYKIPFKKFCDESVIPTAEWRRVKNTQDISKFGLPAVLKSSNGGSSKEVVILKTSQDLKRKVVLDLLNSGLDLFIERFLPGVEITVGVLDNKALPIMEIIPPEGKWFDYKNKYSGVSREVPFAPSVPKKIQQQAQKTALYIHQTLKLGHYSRIDFIVAQSGCHPKGGKLIPYILEVNTIPGLTSESLFPKAALAAGISFEDLVERLVVLATQDHVLQS